MFKANGEKFYKAETKINDSLSNINKIETTINTLNSINMRNYKYKNEVINICNEIAEVNKSLKLLKKWVISVKKSLISLDRDFASTYNNSWKISQPFEYDLLDNFEGAYVFFNDVDIKKSIANFVEKNPDLKSKILETYVEGKLEEVGNWYKDNVTTYQRNSSGRGSGARKYYQTPFGNRLFGDDCTEFVSAYMSAVSGVDIKESYSGGMVYPDGEWAKSVEQNGWKAYSSDSINNLKTGDILVAHAGALYSTKGEHAEVYINDEETFGWGQIQQSYPVKRAIKKEITDGHVHFKDSLHDYITIYRYEGKVK